MRLNLYIFILIVFVHSQNIFSIDNIIDFEIIGDSLFVFSNNEISKYLIKDDSLSFSFSKDLNFFVSDYSLIKNIDNNFYISLVDNNNSFSKIYILS